MAFADMNPESQSGSSVNAHQRIKDLQEEIRLADEPGLDVFAVGEHHRADYAVSTPAVILAAATMLTKKIRLTSTVTVLSSDDPDLLQIGINIKSTELFGTRIVPEVKKAINPLKN